VSVDGDTGSIVEVRPRAGGGWRGRVLYYRSAALLPGFAGELYEAEDEALGFYVDPMPSAVILDGLRRRVVVHTLDAVDVAAAAAGLRNAVKAGDVSAEEHPALEQALTFAMRRPLATAFGFERKNVPCDMSVLNAFAFGLQGAMQHGEVEPSGWVI
jgi:hypothetical protein